MFQLILAKVLRDELITNNVTPNQITADDLSSVTFSPLFVRYEIQTKRN